MKKLPYEKKKRILFLTRRFYPEIGGVETHVLEVARELTDQDYEVKVIAEFCPVLNHNKIKYYQSRGKSARQPQSAKQPFKSSYSAHFYIKKIEVIKFSLGSNEFVKKFIIWWKLLRNINLIVNADIIHCHDVFIWYLPFRFLLPWKKVFVTFHGYEGEYPPSTKAKAIRKTASLLSHGNILIGDFIKKWYDTHSDYVSYGGVSKKESRKIKNKGINKKLHILFIGRLEKDTGVLKYAGILELARKKKIPFVFESCGGGALKKELVKFGKVHGFVSNLEHFILKSDIIFASSYLSILEALSYKKVVLSVYSNPLKEDYLKQSPFAPYIFISDKEYEAANFIESMDNDKKLPAFVERGYEFSKKQTWEKAKNTYLELWKK